MCRSRKGRIRQIAVVRTPGPKSNACTAGCGRAAVIAFVIVEKGKKGSGTGVGYCQEHWDEQVRERGSDDKAERFQVAIAEMRYRGIRPDSPDDQSAVAEIFKRRGLLDEHG